MSSTLDEFAELLQDQAKKQVPIQTEWCKVTAVDWNDKTMTVESLLNELEYFDVLLGLGSIYKKPKLGTKCLIGLIANTNACFMIDCEAFDEMELVSQDSVLTLKKEGFIIKKTNDSLKEVVNNLIDKINDQNNLIIRLSNAVSTVATSVGVSAVIPELVLINQSLAVIAQSNVQNKGIFNKIFVE